MLHVAVDGQAAVLSGVLRGAGRQGIGAATSWCSYWIIGLPLAYLLAFKAQLGVLGLRLSLAVAVAVQALVLHIFTACRIDWQEEVHRARDLVAADQTSGEVVCRAPSGLLEAGSGLLVPAQDSSEGVVQGFAGDAGYTTTALQRPLLASEAV